MFQRNSDTTLSPPCHTHTFSNKTLESYFGVCGLQKGPPSPQCWEQWSLCSWHAGSAMINAFVPGYSAPGCLWDSESIQHLQAQIIISTKDISASGTSQFKTRFLRRTHFLFLFFLFSSYFPLSFFLCFSLQSLNYPPTWCCVTERVLLGL